MHSTSIYHGGPDKVDVPDLRVKGYPKDFGWGFYGTRTYEQARAWALRKKRGRIAYVNRYGFDENKAKQLAYKKFVVTSNKEKCVRDYASNEWLDLIVKCRSCRERGFIPHKYDIVEGPMADDEIYNYIDDFLGGLVTREAFWDLASFSKNTSQISFHTKEALSCLRFLDATVV